MTFQERETTSAFRHPHAISRSARLRNSIPAPGREGAAVEAEGAAVEAVAGAAAGVEAEVAAAVAVVVGDAAAGDGAREKYLVMLHGHRTV